MKEIPLALGDTLIRTYDLGIIGLGHVGSALVGLLQRKQQELAERYGICWRITGVSTRHAGWLVAHEGFAPEKLLAGDFSGARSVGHIASWLHAVKPDVLFEASSLNAETGSQQSPTSVRRSKRERTPSVPTKGRWSMPIGS